MHWVKQLQQPDRRSKVVIVGLTHLVLMFYGIFLTVDDVLNEQYPFSVYEFTFILAYYLGHSVLIYLLFLGLKYSLPILYLPWLSIFLGVFAIASFLWTASLFKATSLYILPFFINLTVLGLCWFSWIIVFKEFMSIFLRSRNNLSSKN